MLAPAPSVSRLRPAASALAALLCLSLAACGPGATPPPTAAPAATLAPTVTAPPPTTAPRVIARPTAPPLPAAETRLSTFGQYAGYSEVRYYRWVRTSQYVPMRDGVRLAVDVLRPADVYGRPATEPLPVIWIYTRQHRAFYYGDQVLSYVDVIPDARLLLEHGYVLAIADARGTGASFGRYEGFLSATEARDAYDLTEWLAAQPWSTGRIGMTGSGYDGANQLLAMSQAPPHLAAIFPASAGFDYFDFVYPGGMYRQEFVQTWSEFLDAIDQEFAPPPVDADPSRRLLAQARAEHAANWNLSGAMGRRLFRGETGLGLDSPADDLASINRSGVAVYLWTGWLDGFVRDGLLWYANLAGPRKLTLGPWEANPTRNRFAYAREYARLRPVEMLRWFDYWLKGVENGIMAEAPIHYATVRAPGLWTWQAASAWPPPETQTALLYAAAGPSGSVASVNDGVLAAAPPTEAEVSDTYTVDLTTTTGRASRWDNLAGKSVDYREMRPNDEKGLTYTTPVLQTDLTLTGSPVITIYVSTAAPDLDLFAYLEEVNARGQSEYITEGALRATYRALAPAPFANFGLPYHPGRPEYLAILPADEPVALVFDLLPISNTFQAGKRLRLTLTGADAGHTEPLDWTAGTTLSVHRGRTHPTLLALPVAPTP